MAHSAPVALVTGAARRLGAVTARALHADGYTVVVHHHTSAAEALALAAGLNAARADSASTVAADLARVEAAETVVGAVTARYGRLDLLVNNASIFERSPRDRIDPAAFERLHAINVRAPYFLSIAATPWLRATRGAIVNITDVHAEHPRRDYAAYCASKAGLLAISRTLALELAPEVRVNCVAPGAILWAASEQDAALQDAMVQATPLARVGDPQDIAAAVCYLAGATFVTGQVLNVDGGRTLAL